MASYTTSYKAPKPMGSNGSAPGAEVSGRILRVRHPELDLTGPFGCQMDGQLRGAMKEHALEGLSKQPPLVEGAKCMCLLFFLFFELMP